jgi:hypothetical protein
MVPRLMIIEVVIAIIKYLPNKLLLHILGDIKSDEIIDASEILIVRYLMLPPQSVHQPSVSFTLHEYVYVINGNTS